MPRLREKKCNIVDTYAVEYLITEVNKKLREGYECVGGPFIVTKDRNTHYCQAMLKQRF